MNMMKAPLLDLKVQHKTIRDEILSILKRTLKEQHFIFDLHVEGFEEKVVACPVGPGDRTGAYFTGVGQDDCTGV